ncbi:nitroreductase family protein [Candidatus Saccharibacteria bacterium]|nr:nitroreductase family protein [Candidatus Saccharibacteria bacterium]
MDAIYKRRSYHDGFSGTAKISDDDIEKIVKAGMNAPSAMNTQPWEFVIVNDPDKLAELANLTPGTRAVATASQTILLCADSETVGYQALNIGMAAQNMLLAAADLNIASLTMGIWPNDEVQTTLRKIINLPESTTAYLMLAFGYVAETLPPNDRWLPERIHYNVF